MTRSDQFRVFMIFWQHASLDQTTEKGEQFIDQFQQATADIMPADLGIGSADLLMVLTKLEEEFGVKIAPEDFHKVGSMTDLFDLLDR